MEHVIGVINQEIQDLTAGIERAKHGLEQAAQGLEQAATLQTVFCEPHDSVSS